MRIIFGCEESQTCTIAFRNAGHEAYSCDVIDCSGGHPEWHFKEDIFEVLAREHFDMGIFFPPCTHLAVSGAAHFANKRDNGKQLDGIRFFLRIATAMRKLKRGALENPIGVMSSDYVLTHFPELAPEMAAAGFPCSPDQIIQPWQFGDAAQKSTCLWLHNLPCLLPTEKEITEPANRGSFYTSPSGIKMPEWYGDAVGANGKKLQYGSDELKKIRSKTFPGIAAAMATQWSNPRVIKHLSLFE